MKILATALPGLVLIEPAVFSDDRGHVTLGEVWDVAVDVRRGSPTFGRWYSVRLSAENHQQLWIPPGFAHGFLALSERADFAYKVSSPYDSSGDRSIRWDDPMLAIAWPLDDAPVVSAKDAVAPLLRDAELPEYAP
jgi:dTDP-4-dehydrorhamnose 3,5-epimerase